MNQVQGPPASPVPAVLNGEPHCTLPSPSASAILKTEVHTPPSKKRKRQPDREPRSPISKSPDHHSPDAKCEVITEDDDETTHKWIRVSPPAEALKECLSTEVQAEEPYNPVAHWVTQGIWPQDFHNKGFKMSETVAKKRSRSRSTSYTQSVKDGINPRAYTPAYENVLTSANIIMDTDDPRITGDSQKLCDSLLNSHHNLPVLTVDALYSDTTFPKLLRRLRARNEVRVLRDLTPIIIPSVEHLDILGYPGLSHLIEELDVEWIKCTSLAGPRPKPDRSVGLNSTAFNEEELEKLRVYTAPNRSTLFTENMYFPFLMGDVKCGDQALSRADRQNMHSSSVAVNAIVQLYKALPAVIGEDGETSIPVKELNRQILVFSISHDHSIVQLYGHYAVIEGDKTSFCRHPLYSLNLSFCRGNERWKFYHFVRSVYTNFTPKHLKRIRSAVAQLPEPSTSITDDDDVVQQEGIPPSIPSSQDDSVFKRPALPLSVQLQQDKDRLEEQVKRDQEDKNRLEEQVERDRQAKDLLQEQMRARDEEMRKLREQVKILLDRSTDLMKTM